MCMDNMGPGGTPPFLDPNKGAVPLPSGGPTPAQPGLGSGGGIPGMAGGSGLLQTLLQLVMSKMRKFK